MNLVEGSNGPRLVCRASGEPQVQYRWFLLRDVGIGSGSGGSDSIISSILGRNNNLRRTNELTAQSIAHGGDQDFSLATSDNQPINQVANKAFDSVTPTGRGANDSSSNVSPIDPLDLNNLIELTASAAEQMGGSSSIGGASILDLSNLSLDRRQSGHYICEASNKLGKSRQSIYINVLCKYNNSFKFQFL